MVLAQGFIDEDLKGPRLQEYLKSFGCERTESDIDQQLRTLNFFHNPNKPARQMINKHEREARMVLDEQIRLAKLAKTEGIPPYKKQKR